MTLSRPRLTCSETFSATEPNQPGTEHLKSTNSTKPPMFIVINHNLRPRRETTSSCSFSHRPGLGSHFYPGTGVLCHSQTHDHGDISSDSYSQDRQDEEDHETKGKRTDEKPNKPEGVGQIRTRLRRGNNSHLCSRSDRPTMRSSDSCTHSSFICTVKKGYTRWEIVPLSSRRHPSKRS